MDEGVKLFLRERPSRSSQSIRVQWDSSARKYNENTVVGRVDRSCDRKAKWECWWKTLERVMTLKLMVCGPLCSRDLVIVVFGSLVWPSFVVSNSVLLCTWTHCVHHTRTKTKLFATSVAKGEYTHRTLSASQPYFGSFSTTCRCTFSMRRNSHSIVSTIRIVGTALTGLLSQRHVDTVNNLSAWLVLKWKSTIVIHVQGLGDRLIYRLEWLS